MDSDLTKKDETITENTQDPLSAEAAGPAAIQDTTEPTSSPSVWDKIRRAAKKFLDILKAPLTDHLPKDPPSGSGSGEEKEEVKE